MRKFVGKTVAVVGGYAGDEGKGKVVTSLVASTSPEFVVRYQGGANAGHTLVVNGVEFKAHLLPSGVCTPGVTNVIGTGVALNALALAQELKALEAAGFAEPILKISARSQLLMPWHLKKDEFEEQVRGGAKLGTTKQGIGPFYEQVAARSGIQAGLLLADDQTLRAAVEKSIAEMNCLMKHRYGQPFLISVEFGLDTLKGYRDIVAPFLCDTETLLYEAQKRGATIILEAQLGVLRDVLHGQHPFVTSSHSLSTYSGPGCGISAEMCVMTIKAYSSMVGTGTRVTAIEDGEFERLLRSKGGNKGEFGATTGRPRDLAWLDLPAARYGARLNRATDIALTCLDVYGDLGMQEIPVCTGYLLDGNEVEGYPLPHQLPRITPKYEVLKGWSLPRQEMAEMKEFYELPQEAQDFVKFIEHYLETPVSIVSTGPADRDYIVRG